MAIYENFSHLQRVDSLNRNLCLVDLCVNHPLMAYKEFTYGGGIVYSDTQTTTHLLPTFIFTTLRASDEFMNEAQFWYYGLRECSCLKILYDWEFNSKYVTAKTLIFLWWATFLIINSRKNELPCFGSIRDKVYELESKTPKDFFLFCDDALSREEGEDNVFYQMINATKALQRKYEDACQKLGTHLNCKTSEVFECRGYQRGLYHYDDDQLKSVLRFQIEQTYNVFHNIFKTLKTKQDSESKQILYATWGIW